MSCQGLLLDLDGTLAESLDVMYGAYSDFLGLHGRAGSKQEFAELNGPPLGVVLQTLKDRHGISATHEELRRTYGSLVLGRYVREVRPAAGALDLLVFCERRAMRLALVTSSSRTIAKAFLQTHRLDRYFQAVIAAEDVRLGKPDPEPYTLALQRLNLPAACALAVEDSPSGLRSSTAAGVRTIFLGVRGHELSANAALVLTCGSLRDVLGILERELDHDSNV